MPEMYGISSEKIVTLPMFGPHEWGSRYLACVEGPWRVAVQRLPPSTFEEVREAGTLGDSGPRNAATRSERWTVSNYHARPLCSPARSMVVDHAVCPIDSRLDGEG
jgi:hypothetical protein